MKFSRRYSLVMLAAIFLVGAFVVTLAGVERIAERSDGEPREERWVITLDHEGTKTDAVLRLQRGPIVWAGLVTNEGTRIYAFERAKMEGEDLRLEFRDELGERLTLALAISAAEVHGQATWGPEDNASYAKVEGVRSTAGLGPSGTPMVPARPTQPVAMDLGAEVPGVQSIRLSESGRRLCWVDVALNCASTEQLSDVKMIAAAPEGANSRLFVTDDGRIFHFTDVGARVYVHGEATDLQLGRGRVRWVEHHGTSLVVAQATALGGTRVLELSLDSLQTVERARDEKADDIVMDEALRVRFSLSREVKRDSSGTSAYEVTVRDVSGQEIGEKFRQVPWLTRFSPTPRIGGGSVHVLGGGELATLSELDAQRGMVFGAAVDGQWADATDVLFSPLDGSVDAVGWYAERLHWHPLTANGKDALWLTTELDADVAVLQRVRDDTLWLVRAQSGHMRSTYYLFDRATREVVRLPLGAEADRRYAIVRPFELSARDGVRLTGYVTIPDTPTHSAGPWPLVVKVHGGPWHGRDQWTVDERSQEWANDGYATLKLNFRGTSGFGWEKMRSARFGREMVNDLVDAIRHFVREGVADSDRVAAVGESYGGYAALRLATAEEPLLRCAAAGFAPTTLAADKGPGSLVYSALGTMAWRHANSPDEHLDRLGGPVLVWSGAQDGENAEVIDTFLARARFFSKTVLWARFPFEGHGLRSAYNLEAKDALVRNFLSRCLGSGVEAPYSPSFAHAELEVRGDTSVVVGLGQRLVIRP